MALPAPASAHVTVDSGSAVTPGGEARVVFRVPNESNTTSTVKLEVYLPTAQPVLSVRTMPVSGWTIDTVTSKLATPAQVEGTTVTQAVTKIAWVATGADSSIKPGQFMEFPVSMGPMPTVNQMTFKALQTYSDGSIVRWIEEKVDADEPDHPAPVLKLAAASAPVAARIGSSGTPITLPLAVVGVITGFLGLTLGAVALARSRRAG